MPRVRYNDRDGISLLSGHMMGLGDARGKGKGRTALPPPPVPRTRSRLSSPTAETAAATPPHGPAGMNGGAGTTPVDPHPDHHERPLVIGDSLTGRTATGDPELLRIGNAPKSSRDERHDMVKFSPRRSHGAPVQDGEMTVLTPTVPRKGRSFDPQSPPESRVAATPSGPAAATPPLGITVPKGPIL